MLENIENRNIVFITLDCCRYDTVLKANTPTIDSLGVLRRAVSYGSYTLPSHISSFHGYLPHTVEEPHLPYYSREVKQLWRLKGARFKESKKVGLFLEGKNIIEGYKNLGYYTLGLGGVRWFKSDTLTNIFDEFHYCGDADDSNVFATRKESYFALSNLNIIKNSLNNKSDWFLFINSHETHVPYDTGMGKHSTEILNILDRAKDMWGGKSLSDVNVRKEEFKLLHNCQVEAMNIVDKRISELINVLPKPFVIVICGDHGESFGEKYLGLMKFGHGFPSKEVMEVPLLVSYVE